MLAKKTYLATAIGGTGTMSYSGMTSFGSGGAPDAVYEAFAVEFAELEDMESQGLVTITYRHEESQTGKHYMDLVKFLKIK